MFYTLRVTIDIYFNDSDDGRCHAGEYTDDIKYSLDRSELDALATKLRRLIDDQCWTPTWRADIRKVWPAYNNETPSMLAVSVVDLSALLTDIASAELADLAQLAEVKHTEATARGHKSSIAGQRT